MRERDEGGFLELLDYRRRVAQLYQGARSGPGDDEARLLRFREERDRLLANHTQSPLEPRHLDLFRGLPYYPLDPTLRLKVPVDKEVEPGTLEVFLAADGPLSMRRIGRVTFSLRGEQCSLSLFWLQGYGGGLFLPFRDASNGAGSYGGGRYLLDSIKGADLGSEGELLVIDFNYAYNPSCAYSPRWDCPLAPQENRLPVAIEAGEMEFMPAAK